MTNSAFQGGERMLSSLTALAIHLIGKKPRYKKWMAKAVRNLTRDLRFEKRS